MEIKEKENLLMIGWELCEFQSGKHKYIGRKSASFVSGYLRCATIAIKIFLSCRVAFFHISCSSK